MPDQDKWEKGDHQQEDKEGSVISYSYRSSEVGNVAERTCEEKNEKQGENVSGLKPDRKRRKKKKRKRKGKGKGKNK
jgi:hypothetical protein